MSAYVRFSPEFVKRKPSWYFYSACVYVPPISGFLWSGHTYLLDKYKELVSYCENGKPVPVPADLKETFNKVKQDLPTPQFYKKFLSVFMVNGFDTFYAGSTKQLYGAIVGIPKIFTYKSVKDAQLDAAGMRIQESPVQWELVDPEVKNKFFNSLVFSEKAIKYAMAYNCLLTDNVAMTFYPMYPIFLAASNTLIGEFFSRKLKLRGQPIIYSVAVAVLVFSSSICAWISLVDGHKYLLEKSVNALIVKMDDEYIEGAIEYWTKLTERNIALRSLMKDGESKFSVRGKESYLLGSPGVLPIDQKHFYEQALKERKEEKEKVDNLDVGTSQNKG